MRRPALLGLVAMSSAMLAVPVVPAPAAASDPPPGSPAILWEAAIATPRHDYVNGIAVRPGGGVVVVGSTWGVLGDESFIGEDAFVRAYAEDLSVEWTRQFGTPNGDRALGVAVDPDGRVYVAGATASALPGQVAAGYQDAFVASFEADGTPGWTRQFGTEYTDEAAAVAVTPAGGIVVAGSIGAASDLDPDESSSSDVLVRSYTRAGAPLWSRTIDSAGHDRDSGRAVAVGNDGLIYVAGTAADLPGVTMPEHDEGLAAFVLALDANGDSRWASAAGDGDWDDAWGHGIAVSPTGDVLLVGSMADDPGIMFTRAYGSDGSVAWGRDYVGRDENWASAVATDGAGDVFVVGGTESWGDPSAALVAVYAPDGTPRWLDTFDIGPASSWSTAVAVDPSGNAYVVGNHVDPAGHSETTDAFIRKYGPTPPTARVSRLPDVTLAASTPATWSALPTLQPVTAYDVRYQRARWNGGFGAYVPWQTATTATTATLALLPGSTYCVSAMVSDTAGLTSAWTSPTCTAVPLDDRSLSRSSGWTQGTGGAYYASTYVRASRLGAKLTRTGVVGRRLSLIATTCPTCGTVKVYLGTTRLRTISLYSSTTVARKVIPIITFPSARSGTVVIRVASSGKKVLIDGLAIRRD